MVDPNKPSSVRVFGKSLHFLTAGWVGAVGWLWFAGLEQYVLRNGSAPADFGLSTLAMGVVSAIAIEAAAIGCVRWTGRAPHRWLERQEWHHAFWWSAVPNLLLLATVYLMIVAAY
jgi:hypothetical protein